MKPAQLNYQYTKAFDQIDSDGEDQISTDEAIATRLFDDYLNDSRQFDQIEHSQWIIQRVAATFGTQDTALLTSSLLAGTMSDHLRNWRNSLDTADTNLRSSVQYHMAVLLHSCRQMMLHTRQQISMNGLVKRRPVR